ncbi:MAG: DNA replication/repair protein RecF, partial [Flavobacteriales bacterium]
MAGMITLNKLSLFNYRNYGEATASFIPEMNCLLGPNGSGKTNLLDAIHYLSFCKSAFNPVDRNNIKLGESAFVIKGDYTLNGKDEVLSCAVQKGRKKLFRRNKKEYGRLADHIGLFPLVMVSPADADLITGGSELRRRMMDVVISQYDKEYLLQLISYNKALLQRNALLKQFAREGRFDPSELELWDERMLEPGLFVSGKRSAFLDEFIPVFNQLFTAISGGEEEVSLAYRAGIGGGDFADMLRKNMQRDRALLY